MDVLGDMKEKGFTFCLHLLQSVSHGFTQVFNVEREQRQATKKRKKEKGADDNNHKQNRGLMQLGEQM